MHVMTVIDFLITSNDKSYRTQYSQIEYFAIYLGGWRPLQQRFTASNFLFFLSFFFFFVNLHFLWACNRYMQSLPSLRLYITIQKTKLCHLYFLPRTRKVKMLAIYCYLSLACFSVFLHYKGSEEIKTLWTFYRLMCCFPTPITDMIKWGLFTLSAFAFKNDRHSLKT